MTWASSVSIPQSKLDTVTEADFDALQLDAQIKAPFGEKVAVRVLGLAVEHFVANDEAGGILDVAIAA